MADLITRPPTDFELSPGLDTTGPRLEKPASASVLSVAPIVNDGA